MRRISVALQGVASTARWATGFVLVLAAVPALAQAPIPVSPQQAAPAAATGTSVPPEDSGVLLDEIAGLVNRGKLNVEVDLQAGRAASSPDWTVRVIGAPKVALVVEADEGRVSCLDVAVTGGELIVDGQGLRPHLTIEGIRFEAGKGITEARFRGRGIWRPIVAVFRTLARPALRRLDLRTDIPSILRGDILSSTPSPNSSGAVFLDLVREVRIADSEFVAFGGSPLELGQIVAMKTSERSSTGTPLRAAISKGTFRPQRGDQPAQFEVDGRIDGEIEQGSVAFVGSRCTFSHGELKEGTFKVSSGKDGQALTSFSAGALTLDLTSGQFLWPGGPKVGVEAPSRFAVRNLRVRPDGRYSGIVDAALFGKVGAIEREGMAVAASDVQVHTQGAAINDGRATGDLKLDFQYLLNHTLVVHYPVQEIGDRRVPLKFQGSFASNLHFEDAGSGDEGVVTGTYQFTIPWPPIEQAAFEVLRAKWLEDIAPAIRKVQFVIEPRHFGPCGRDCFLLDLVVTAEKAKTKNKGYFFQEICNTQARADLVVDTPSRSLILRNVRVEPRCEGAIGAIVDFLAPFLKKTYSEVTLMQMPANLPFTIESVASGADSILIAGKVAWAMK